MAIFMEEKTVENGLWAKSKFLWAKKKASCLLFPGLLQTHFPLANQEVVVWRKHLTRPNRTKSILTIYKRFSLNLNACKVMKVFLIF